MSPPLPAGPRLRRERAGRAARGARRLALARRRRDGPAVRADDVPRHARERLGDVAAGLPHRQLQRQLRVPRPSSEAPISLEPRVPVLTIVDVERNLGRVLVDVRPDALAFRNALLRDCLLYTSPSPRDATLSRMPSSA